MTVTTPDTGPSIEKALTEWRQGDVALNPDIDFVHIADLSYPLTDVTRQVAEENNLPQSGAPDIAIVYDDIPGVVVLTQTCDIVRSPSIRPFIEIAPLTEVQPYIVAEVRRLRRPTLAYVPAVAAQNLVADLNRSMTVEKSIVRLWERVSGCSDDEEARNFADALARHRSRFAFPDDFTDAFSKFSARLRKRHDKGHEEGAHLKALREIRVRAAPAWSDDSIQLGLWFIIDSAPQDFTSAWDTFLDKWTGLIDESGRFSIEFAVACRLEDLTAKDYIESDRLDLDNLSVSR